MTIEKRNQILTLRRTGMGYATIAKNVGEKRDAVRYICKNMGLGGKGEDIHPENTYARGWLNYYGIASMKNNIDDVNGWLYRRIRMCIWKQWKKPKTKMRNLFKMGIPEYYAHMAANSRRGHWFNANLTTVKRAMSKRKTDKQWLL